VIFATAYHDFESRLRFARSGGDDFIAKPYLPSELATKALGQLLKTRLAAANERPISPHFKGFQP
jgi:CheY-like chemotaxis protein